MNWKPLHLLKTEKPFCQNYQRRSKKRIFFSDYILIMEKIFPYGFVEKEYAMDDKKWFLFLRHLSSLASDYKNIDENTRKHLGKLFQNMSFQEKKQFYKKKFDIFREKYKTLARLEAFQSLLIFVNENFEEIFPVCLGLGKKKRHYLKWLQKTNQLYLDALEKNTFLISNFERNRINYMKINMNALDEKIKKLIYKRKKIYYEVFCHGTAKKVDIFGVRQIICSYVGP